MKLRAYQIALVVILAATVADAKRKQPLRNVQWIHVHREVCRRLKVERKEWFLDNHHGNP